MSAPTGTPVLQIEGASVRFGGLYAVNMLELTVHPGQLHGLIGPNGAGKTTVFNLISGIYSPSAGVVRFLGHDTRGLGAHQLSKQGIARTFQNIRLFSGLSVIENVKVALTSKGGASGVHAVLRTPRYYREEAAAEKRALELLALFNLQELRDKPAKSLPYGEQRRLEIVRALATSPKLLLLDEPAAGMTAVEKGELVQLIRRIRDEFDLAILLVEHSMRVVMGVCETITVLDYGVKIASGPPEAIKTDPKVLAAYLGEDHATNLAHH